MSTRSRVIAFEVFLAIIILLNITSAKTNLEKSNRYTYGENVTGDEQEPIRCQLGNDCEAQCVQENKSSAVVLNDTRCATIGYHIIFVFSKKTSLRAGWFVNNALIRRITIRDVGFIAEIEAGAFEDSTFRHVSRLELRGTTITSLKQGSLAGLNNLKSLSLIENSKMTEICENVLLGLFQLEEFTMEEQKQLSDLSNITEKIDWKYLHTLNLSKNSFGTTILETTFMGCARVKNLILSNSEIVAIGSNSFEPMANTIEILDLSNNRLTRLPYGLLENLIRSNVQFFLSKNLWDCGCAASELQGYEINYPSLVKDSPLICVTPLSEKGNSMKTVSIGCFSTTPYVPTSTNPSSESTDINLDRLSCIDQTDPYQPGIAVETEYHFFKVKQEGDDQITVEMNYPDSSLALVYMNDHDYHARCQYTLKRRMEFKSLNSNAGHLFCLIKKSSYATSPRNCLPFHFAKHFNWGRDRIVITLVCTFALAIGLGIITGWVFICRYRRVSRAVSRQGSRDSKAKMIIDDFNSWSAYQHRKFFMKSNYSGTNLRRSVSENSLASQKTYLKPSPFFDVMQHRNQKIVRNSDVYSMRDYMDKLPYDIVPPPLPPLNNGRKESIYATITDPPFSGEYVPYVYLQRKY